MSARVPMGIAASVCAASEAGWPSGPTTNRWSFGKRAPSTSLRACCSNTS